MGSDFYINRSHRGLRVFCNNECDFSLQVKRLLLTNFDRLQLENEFEFWQALGETICNFKNLNLAQFCIIIIYFYYFIFIIIYLLFLSLAA